MPEVVRNIREREMFCLSTAVFVQLVQGGKTLFLLRGNTGWMDGRWALPGGVKEPGETLEQAARREVKEEVGVTVGGLELVHIMHNFTTGREWLGVFFLATEWAGQIAIQEPHKHGDLEWFDLRALPENLSPYILQALSSTRLYSEFGWDVPPDANEEAYIKES